MTVLISVAEPKMVMDADEFVDAVEKTETVCGVEGRWKHVNGGCKAAKVLSLS